MRSERHHIRCRGTGEVYLARNADELHVVDLDGESLTVNGADVVAFDPGLTWDIRKIEGATVVSGDVFDAVFTGTGRIVLSACGTPIVLDAARAPTSPTSGRPSPGRRRCRPEWCAPPSLRH